MMRELRLERRRDGQLWALTGDGGDGAAGGRAVAVRARRCFPWSQPAGFVSLRDFDDEEIALVRGLDELDLASRKLLEEVLVEAGFVLEIERILGIEEEIEIRSWRVVTRQGPRSFQTPRDEWPRELPCGGFLIRDVAGDLYRVSKPEDLDTASQRLLWAFVD
jgi:hypothetical protein